MGEHVNRISEIIATHELGQKPDHSGATIAISPPIKPSSGFVKAVLGRSKYNLSVEPVGTFNGRTLANKSGDAGATYFMVEVGRNEYSEEDREEIIRGVAKRMCTLADDPLLATEMLQQDPFPHPYTSQEQPLVEQ